MIFSPWAHTTSVNFNGTSSRLWWLCNQVIAWLSNTRTTKTDILSLVGFLQHATIVFKRLLYSQHNKIPQYSTFPSVHVSLCTTSLLLYCIIHLKPAGDAPLSYVSWVGFCWWQSLKCGYFHLLFYSSLFHMQSGYLLCSTPGRH